MYMVNTSTKAEAVAASAKERGYLYSLIYIYILLTLPRSQQQLWLKRGKYYTLLDWNHSFILVGKGGGGGGWKLEPQRMTFLKEFPQRLHQLIYGRGELTFTAIYTTSTILNIHLKKSTIDLIKKTQKLHILKISYSLPLRTCKKCDGLESSNYKLMNRLVAAKHWKIWSLLVSGTKNVMN